MSYKKRRQEMRPCHPARMGVALLVVEQLDQRSLSFLFAETPHPALKRVFLRRLPRSP